MPDNKKLSLDELHHEKHKSSVRRFLFFAALAYVIVTMSAWLWWNNSLQKPLKASIARLEKRFGPIDARILDVPQVPDEQNAAYWLEKAIESYPFNDEYISQDAQLKKLYDEYKEIECSDTGMVELVLTNANFFVEVEKLSSKSFEYCRRAAECEHMVWGNPDGFRLNMGPVKNMIRLYRWTMIRDGINGDSVSFAKKFSICDQIAKQICKSSKQADVALTKALIGDLVCISVDALAGETIFDVASMLDVSTLKNRQAVMDMLRHLGDAEDRYDFAESSLLIECKAWLIDEYEYDYEGIMFILDLIGLDAPANKHKANLVDAIYDTCECVKNGCIGGVVKEYMLLSDEERDKLEPPPSIWDFIDPTIYYKVIDIKGASIARRNIAAVMLAMRLYEHDNGQLPGNIDQLVGEYLPKSPIDPFSDRQPIKMAVDSDGDHLVYSNWRDFSDDGGLVEDKDSYCSYVIAPDYVKYYRIKETKQAETAP